MKILLIAAVSSLAFAAGGSTALAEDRAATVGDGREAGDGLLAAETADNDAADETPVGDGEARSCGRPVPTSSAFGGCGSDRRGPRNLKRQIDWSSVGPSADDFAESDEGLRLQGARLVGTYRF